MELDDLILSITDFKAEELTPKQVPAIQKISFQARRAIVKMTSNAGSGKLGGPLSSVDLYLLLWLGVRVKPFSEKKEESSRKRRMSEVNVILNPRSVRVKDPGWSIQSS